MGDRWQRQANKIQRECTSLANRAGRNAYDDGAERWQAEQVSREVFQHCLQQYYGYLPTPGYGYGYPPSGNHIPREQWHPDNNCIAGTGECSWERPRPRATPPVPAGRGYNGGILE